MELSFDVRNWWAFVLRGIVAIAFGLLTWLFPGMALLSLVLLFGAYAIVDGASAIAVAVKVDKAAVQRPRWPLVLYAAASVIAGVVAFFAPGLTALALLLVIAVRAIVTGALEIIAAIHLRKEIRGEWLLGLSGALSVAFGVVLVLFPGPGALGLLLWIGTYAIVLGGILVALGAKLRGMKRRASAESGHVGGTLAESH